MAKIDWLERAKQQPIVDIGQIPANERRALDRAAKRGEITKWRGFWDSFSPDFGMGRPKTCFGPMSREAMVDLACSTYGAVVVSRVAEVAMAIRNAQLVAA